MLLIFFLLFNIFNFANISCGIRFPNCCHCYSNEDILTYENDSGFICGGIKELTNKLCVANHMIKKRVRLGENKDRRKYNPKNNKTIISKKQTKTFNSNNFSIEHNMNKSGLKRTILLHMLLIQCQP